MRVPVLNLGHGAGKKAPNESGKSTWCAFLLAMLRGYPAEQCVRLAAAEGASCVEEFDALTGVRTLEELEQKIRSGWKQRD